MRGLKVMNMREPLHQPFALCYPPQVLDDWKNGRRDTVGYPRDELRYRYTNAKPPKYFAEAWTTRYFVEAGYECWHERYQLENQPKYDLNRRANAPIFEKMGIEAVQKLLRGIRKVEKAGFMFKNPDVIAYDPRDSSWLFLEAKLDTTKDERRHRVQQAASLRLLRDCVPNSQSVFVWVCAEGKDLPKIAYKSDSII